MQTARDVSHTLYPLPAVHMAADSYLEALAEAEHKIYYCIVLTFVQFINPLFCSVAPQFCLLCAQELR